MSAEQIGEHLQGNVLESGKRFSRRTVKWCWVAGITLAVTSAAMLATGRHIGSPELFVVTLGSLVLSWLVVSILLSRGRFRIVSMLVLCTVVAIFSSMLLPRMRTAAAHKRLMSELLAAGGGVGFQGRKPAYDENGWFVTRDGYAFPKVLERWYEYFEGGQVNELAIPMDIVRDELFRGVRFAESCRVTLLLQGESRNVAALENLVRVTKQDYVYVQGERMSQSDAEYLRHVQKPVIVTFDANSQTGDTPVLRLADIRRAASFAAAVIITGSMEIAESDSPKETIQNAAPLKICLYCSGHYNATLFDALAGCQNPIQIDLENATLTDEAWQSLSKLLSVELLRLHECHPTEAQLLAITGWEKLTSIKLRESKISESCLQEFSKIGTLENVYLRSPSIETIRCFLENNPNLRNFQVPGGFKYVFKGTRFATFGNMSVDDLKAALHEYDSLSAERSSSEESSQ